MLEVNGKGKALIEIVAKISSKNQITLPADIRRRLGVGAEDKIAVVVQPTGDIVVRPVRYDLHSIFGSVKALPGETFDLDLEIAEATEEEISRTLARQHE